MVFCNPFSKLIQFYNGNIIKCRKRKKSVCRIKPSKSSSFDDNNNNFLFLSIHVEQIKKYLLIKDDDSKLIICSGKCIPYTTLFRLLPDDSKWQQQETNSDTLDIRDDAMRFMGRNDTGNYYSLYQDTSTGLEDNENTVKIKEIEFDEDSSVENNEITREIDFFKERTSTSLEQIASYKEAIEKLEKENEELASKVQQLENLKATTYKELRIELESSNISKIKLGKEIEFSEMKMEKLRIEYEMKIENLEKQLKVEKDNIKCCDSEMCLMRLKLDEVMKLKKETEENSQAKIKSIKKETVELRATISYLEKVNFEHASQIKYNEDCSLKEVNSLKKNCNELEQKVQDLEKELMETKISWESESTTLKTQLEEYCVKTTTWKTQIQVYKKRNNKVEEILLRLRGNIVEIEKEKINLKCNLMFQSKEIEMLGEKIRNLSVLSSELKKQVSLLKGKECKLNDALIVKEKELENICYEKVVLRKDVHKFYGEMEIIKNENKQISLYLIELKKKLKAYKEDKIKTLRTLNEKTKEIEHLVNEKCDLDNKITALSLEKSCLQERVNNLLKNLCKCEAKIKNTNNTTSTNLNQLNKYASTSSNEDDLNKFLRKGLMNGIESLDVYELAILHESICNAAQTKI